MLRVNYREQTVHVLHVEVVYIYCMYLHRHITVCAASFSTWTWQIKLIRLIYRAFFTILIVYYFSVLKYYIQEIQGSHETYILVCFHQSYELSEQYLCPRIEWSKAYVLSICLVNFNFYYNFWTIRDRDVIFGMHSLLMIPIQMKIGWIYGKSFGSLVSCGLTSHSVIFQRYSDGTVVQFPNLDLLPGTQCHGQLGGFNMPSLPWCGHRDIQTSLTSLPSEGPHAVRVCEELNPDLIHSSPLPLCHCWGWHTLGS